MMRHNAAPGRVRRWLIPLLVSVAAVAACVLLSGWTRAAWESRGDDRGRGVGACARSDDDVRPGFGRGDVGHDHAGPPGRVCRVTPTATSTRARCEEDEEDDEGECTRTPTVTATATFTPTATATSTVTPTATPTRVSQPTLVLVPTSGPAATLTTGTWTASGFPSGDAIGLTVTNLSCNNPPELSYSVVVPNTTGTTSGTFSISGGEPNCQVSIAALDQATQQSASVTFTFT